MEEQITTTPEVKEESETTENTEQETAVAEPTVADLHEEETPEPTKKKKPITQVPKARLNKEIQRRKDLEQELKELRGDLEEDLEVDDVEENPEVKKLAERLESIEKKERMEKMEAVFIKNLNATLENVPEYKDVVNIDVIKSLAFNPANKDKTYKQLLEEAYGNALNGRRTVENTTPRGGAKDAKLDRERATKDVEYRREVLADPELRKQYNEGLTDRVFR